MIASRSRLFHGLLLFFAALLFFFGDFFINRLNGQEIMTLSQIRPGMRGYGLTVFKGTKVEKFNFEIKGIYDDGPDKFIIVLLSGGPKDELGRRLIDLTNIFQGMSGAPLYINGKIIGALRNAWNNTKIPLAGAVPIEDMVRLWPLVSGGQNKFLEERMSATSSDPMKSIDVGEMYSSCEVWGYGGYCSGISGHITFRDRNNGNIFYSLGHPASNSSGASITGVPVWRGKIVALLPNSRSSDVLVNREGPILGSVVFNGPHGQIIKIGAVSKSFPVHISMEGHSYGRSQYDYFFAYTPNAPSNIASIISKRASLIDNSFDVEEEISIVTDGLGEIHYKSAMERVIDIGSGSTNSITMAKAMLKSLLGDELRLVIKKIDITLRAVPKYNNLRLKAIFKESGDDANSVYLGLRAVGQQEWLTKFTFSKEHFGKTLILTRGSNIFQRILVNSGVLSSKTIDLLNEVSDGYAIYLCYLSEENVLQNQLNKSSADNSAGLNQPLQLGAWLAKPSGFSLEVILKIKQPCPSCLVDGELSFGITNNDESKEEKKN